MRRAAFLAALLLIIALALYTTPWPQLADRIGDPWNGPTTMAVVRPGDTLWAIARRYMPTHDPRQVVDWIRYLNPGIDAGALQAGTTLRVPLESQAVQVASVEGE